MRMMRKWIISVITVFAMMVLVVLPGGTVETDVDTVKPTEVTTVIETTQPTTQPVTQPVTQVIESTGPSVTEPVTEEVTEPVTEPVTESVTEEVPECFSEIPVEAVDSGYLGTYQATWYTAVDMGYSATPYGAAGRDLETAYSVASNSIPLGSIIRITGSGLDGIYRVDDRGGMSDNVIDFYYYDRSFIPDSFLQAGILDIEVYIID